MNKRTALVILCLALSGCGLLNFTPQPGVTPAPSATSLPLTLRPPIPTYTQTPVTGVYQAFERGFMVYVEGADCLYAYAEGIIIPAELSSREMGMYHYCVEFDALPAAPADAPADPFGRVWAGYVEMSTFLGAAVGAVERYRTVIPHSDPVIMGGVFYAGMLTLPDGQRLYCGTRGATAGSCQLRR